MGRLVILMLVASLVLVCTTTQAQAEVLAYEGFDYLEDDFIGKDMGLGFVGPWAESGAFANTEMGDGTGVYGTVVPPGGAYVGGATGRLAELFGTDGTAAVTRTLATPLDFAPTEAQTYYFSMLFRRQDGSNGGGTESLRFFDFRDDASPGTPLLIIGTDSSEQGWVLLGAYGNQAYTSGAVYQLTSEPNDVHNNLVVAKLIVRNDGDDVISASFYESGTDTVPATEPASWDVTYQFDVSGVSSANVISVQKFGGAMIMDEMRIGTTYQDVIERPQHFCIAYPELDFDQNCVVDMADFTVFAQSWLFCNENDPADCGL